MKQYDWIVSVLDTKDVGEKKMNNKEWSEEEEWQIRDWWG